MNKYHNKAGELKIYPENRNKKKRNRWVKAQRKKPKYRMHSIKSDAKRRGLAFENNSHKLETMTALLGTNCYYCNKENCLGLDRINNRRGYFLDNVLPCCGSCNMSRNQFFSVDEFKVMITALMEYRKKTKK